MHEAIGNIMRKGVDFKIHGLGHRKTLGEKTMNPAGFLNALAVDEKICLNNQSVVTGSKH